MIALDAYRAVIGGWHGKPPKCKAKPNWKDIWKEFVRGKLADEEVKNIYKTSMLITVGIVHETICYICLKLI